MDDPAPEGTPQSSHSRAVSLLLAKSKKLKAEAALLEEQAKAIMDAVEQSKKVWQSEVF